jgi:parallel beta-helix repeat protein
VQKVKSPISWKAFGDTHPGKLRENNEDRIHFDAEKGLFIVVDGMGGEAAGEQAAQRAVQSIQRRMQQETGTVARRIREAIASASTDIYRLSQSNPEWQGMACVLTVAAIEDDTIHVGHVGDTRLYVIDGSGIRKLTPDHSPIGRREDAGELTELEAMHHPRRNEVYRDVGSSPHRPDDEDFVEYLQAPFAPDSALLLCSDGLYDMVTSAEILRTVKRCAGNPRDTVQELIRQANTAGGKDNISVIVVEGRDFAAAARPHEAEPASAFASSGAGGTAGGAWRPLAGRWFMFLYGVMAGVLLLTMLDRYLETGVPEPELPLKPPASKIWSVNRADPEMATISQALEKAQPGDRIEVASGEYTEQLRLKEGVSVAAAPGAAVVIRGPAGSDAIVISDKVKRAELSGVVIKAGPDPAVPVGILIANSDLRLSNVEVSGAAKAGIWIDGDSDASLVGNNIHSNKGTGIVLAGFSTPFVVGNVVRNNGSAGAAAPGILVTESSDPHILRNAIFANTAEGIRVPQQGMTKKVADNFFAVGGKPNKGGSVGVQRAGVR